MSKTTVREFFIESKSLTMPKKGLVVVAGSLLMAVSAQLAFPMPFTPVPVTMQTFMAILLGLVFGSRLGTLALALYLFEGVIGLPFFSLGTSGMQIILGPTGGYLLGMVAAASIAGGFSRNQSLKPWQKALIAGLVGHVVILSSGIFWPTLQLFSQNSTQLVSIGLLPFLPGTFFKIALLMLVFPRFHKN